MTLPVCKSDADCVKAGGDYAKGCCLWFDPGTANISADIFKTGVLPTTKG